MKFLKINILRVEDSFSLLNPICWAMSSPNKSTPTPELWNKYKIGRKNLAVGIATYDLWSFVLIKKLIFNNVVYIFNKLGFLLLNTRIRQLYPSGHRQHQPPLAFLCNALPVKYRTWSGWTECKLLWAAILQERQEGKEMNYACLIPLSNFLGSHLFLLKGKNKGWDNSPGIMGRNLIDQ